MSESGRLTIRINRIPVVDVLLHDLIRRGPWGVPVDWEIGDRDDIAGNIEHGGRVDTTICINLLGILRTGVPT